MAHATLLLDYRQSVEGGFVVTVRIWRVPEPVAGSVHPFKDSLLFGRPGRRMGGNDKGRGKGDHRHDDDRQEKWDFVSIERLIADFGADVARLKGALW
jgi:hypothetical protein